MKKIVIDRAFATAKDALLAGQQDHNLKVMDMPTPKKPYKRLRKRLKASEEWSSDSNGVYTANGIVCCGIASRGGRICVQLDGQEHRYQILYLDRFGRRTVYLLPITTKDKKLPGIDLSDGELHLLQAMADDISDGKAQREYLIKMKNPLRHATMSRVHSWCEKANTPEVLLDLLEECPVLLQILVAALDAQLRALKELQHIPVGLYNFICPQRDAAAQEWLLSVLRAVTFSTENSEYPGPIVALDLDMWSRCYQRLTIINATSRDVIRPILSSLQERDQLRKCGGCPPPYTPTLPISVSKSAVCSPFCVDVQLPKGLTPLSDDQQDLLRLAMGKILSTKTANTASDTWADRMCSLSAYRWSGFEVWRSVLAERMVKAWFDTDEQRGRATNLFQQSQQQQEADVQVRSAAIRSAYEYLADPAQYKERITGRPANKESAEDLLSDTFFAFRFEPAKGHDKGAKFLAFNEGSLRRLLRSINVGDENYDAVLDFCEKEGFLVRRDHSITLGGETFHGITFKEQM